MADAFELMNRGCLGSSGAGGGDATYNGALPNMLAGFGIKIRDTNGFAAGTSVADKPIPGIGSIFASNRKPGFLDKVMNSLREGLKNGSQGGGGGSFDSGGGGGGSSPALASAAAAPAITGGEDVTGPPSGGTWVAAVRGGGNARGADDGGMSV
jgi:hypothetical protein